MRVRVTVVGVIIEDPNDSGGSNSCGDEVCVRGRLKRGTGWWGLVRFKDWGCILL